MVICGLKLLPLIFESAGAKILMWITFVMMEIHQEKINIARLSGSQFEILRSKELF